MIVTNEKLVLKLLMLPILLGARRCLAQSFPVEKYRLSNGMTIILRVDHSLPLASVNIWYRVGSKDEPPSHSGFAHLFEHLMFMGTRRVPTGQFDRIMESGGGDNNATTAEDRTNFFDYGPSILLPTLLWLEADRLEELGKSMTQAKLDLQREVVKNERRETTENRPYGKADEMVNGIMFPPGHPYHTSVIGSMSDLDHATVEDVQKFFATFYVPNNASMVVAGDFDVATTKRQIASLFGSLPRGKDVPRKPLVDPSFSSPKDIHVVDQVQASKIMLIWHTPPNDYRGDAEANLAASVLADGVNSRLYQRLVVKDKLATEVDANVDDLLLGSLFEVDVLVRQGVPVEKVQRALDDEILSFREHGPTEEELRRQGSKIESQILNSNQSLDTLADSLNAFEFYRGSPDSFRWDLERYRVATPKSVQLVAQRFLAPQMRARIVITPGASVPDGPAADAPATSSAGTATAVAKSADVAAKNPVVQAIAPAEVTNPRDIRPPLGRPKTFHPPAPTAIRLANGSNLYYWHRSSVPLVSLAIQLESGSLQDPPSKSGLTALTADMLKEGAGGLDAVQVRTALDLLGASVNAGASSRTTTVTLDVLARNFVPAAKLFGDVLKRPRLSEQDFERLKRVEIAALTEASEDVSEVASRVGEREFFGSSSPFGRSTDGTPSTVARIGIADVRRRYLELRGEAPHATFFAAGSLSDTEIAKVLNREFGKWRPSFGSQHAPKPPVYEYPTRNSSTSKSSTATYSSRSPRLFIVDKPGAPQTAIEFLMPAPKFASPTRLALRALTTIMGGLFTSRLNQNLREDKGYTYGAFASASFDRDFGLIVAHSEVRADVTGASIKEFLKEFDRMRSDGVTEAELRSSVTSMQSNFVRSFASLDGLVGQALVLHTVGQTLQNASRDADAFHSLSAQQLSQIAKAAFPYEDGVIVLVGDAKNIRSQISGLGLPTPQAARVY